MIEATGRERADRVGAGGKAARLALLAGLGLAGLAGMGCEADSWLFDTSVVGRGEYTPTTVPILERLDVIERESGQYVEISRIQPEDLMPEVSDYEFGPGDAIQIEIWDFVIPGQPDQRQVVIDPRGFIELPQIGRMNVLGLTTDEIRELVRQTLRDRGIIQDALVSVTSLQQRQQTFSVFGAVVGTGRYFVPSADYRLLEALTEAGGVSPAIPKIYVIRQTPLTDISERGLGVERAPKPRMDGQPAPVAPGEPEGRDINDLIRELTTDPSNSQPPADEPPIDLPGEGQDAPPNAAVFGTMERGRGRAFQNGADPQGGGAPPIDLEDAPSRPQPAPPVAPPIEQELGSGPGRWMFLNGEWVRVTRRPAGQGLPDAPGGLPQGVSQLVTQRVIEIPTRPLLQGAAEYNIVVRPGDVIHVPPPEIGNWYIGGPGIARPGTYSLPATGRLTLSRAIMAAGGLNSIGVPWKVDLIRMVGDNRQATVRLNLRAIMEGTNPDVFLKDQDSINVGTSFFATPAAIMRNGFRFTYGFGFLLDRNFGNDVFGPPPDDNPFN